MANLEHPIQAEYKAVRGIILEIDAQLTELINWNVPSFILKNAFATFKLRPTQTIQVVMHPRAKITAGPAKLYINYPSGLLKWVIQDCCLVPFIDSRDIETKKADFVAI